MNNAHLSGLPRGELAKLNKAFCRAIRPTHFITLATNWDGFIRVERRAIYDPSRADKIRMGEWALELWGAKVDRDMLGGRWHRKPDLRMRGFAVPEHIDTNFHYHCFINVAEHVCRVKFETLAAKRWDRAPWGGVASPA